FFVVHGHTLKGFTDVACSGQWIRVAIRPFGINVNQAHLGGSEWILQVSIVYFTISIVVSWKDCPFFLNALGAVSIPFVTTQPDFFGAPIDVFIGFPRIRTAAREAECFESHGLE